MIVIIIVVVITYWSCLAGKFLSQKFLPVAYKSKVSTSIIWIIAFWWIASHRVQVKVGSAALSLEVSFEENLYIQSNRVGNRRRMCFVAIRRERKGENSVIWKLQKRPQKWVRKSKTKQKKFQKTLSNTFVLFKDFARPDKCKARLANWMKCSWDIYSLICNCYSSSRLLIDEKVRFENSTFFQVSWW